MEDTISDNHRGETKGYNELSVLASEFVNLILSSNFKMYLGVEAEKGLVDTAGERRGWGKLRGAALIHIHCQSAGERANGKPLPNTGKSLAWALR